MLSDRQLKILDYLVRQYLEAAEPVSSGLLSKRPGFSVSPATIRNELQELTELGYVTQPHTSAGRVPTEKGYKLFIEITFTLAKPQLPKYLEKEIGQARQQIGRELTLAQELAKKLSRVQELLYIETAREDILLDVLKLLGPARQSHPENVEAMQKLLEKLKNF